jgi:hypothetical protein
MRVFVLVPTYKAFVDWCSMRHVNPKAAECVTDPTTLFGKLQKGDQVIDARSLFTDLPTQLVA